MVDDVAALLGSDHHRDHVPPQEGGPVLVEVLAPLPLFLVHLPQADGDLGRSQIGELDRIDQGFAVGRHRPCD